MRRTLLSLFALWMLCLSASAHLVWLERVHDFGAFDEDMGVVTCRFRALNAGPDTVAILGARANCGCTRPEYPSAPVAPGDTVVITVGYDPKGRPGKFAKRVYVDASVDPARTTLDIKGTVIGASNTLKSRYPSDLGAMKLRSTTLAYGQVIKDQTIGKFLEGYNASSDTLRPVVTSVPRHISVIIEPAAVAPGEQFVISTVFNSSRLPDWGVWTGHFDLAANPGETPVEIETVAIIKEDFSSMTPAQMDRRPVVTVSESKIDFGVISRESKPLTRTFTVTNSGDDPLIIRQISCPDKGVTLKCEPMKVKKGKQARVTVTVNPAELTSAELLNARITLTVNDPLHPTEIIRLVGQLR